jgi:hypothetical protein
MSLHAYYIVMPVGPSGIAFLGDPGHYGFGFVGWSIPATGWAERGSAMKSRANTGRKA